MSKQKGWSIIPQDWVRLNSIVNELGYLILDADSSFSDMVAETTGVSNELVICESNLVVLSDSINTVDGGISNSF
jgi:hypothetical protein